MVQFISEKNCLEAWERGCDLLLKDNVEKYNLITTIRNPAYFSDEWLKTHDPNPTGDNPSLSDVINTIFPYKLSKRLSSGDRRKLYEHYLTLHHRKTRLGGKKRTRWGTYFERIICFGGKKTNQLEDVIEVLLRTNDWLKATNPIHISSSDYDSIKKKMGNPCLQYIQFIQPQQGKLSLTAVYRNHDYLNKALGNFIGLGQLLKFVAKHTNKDIGEVHCHSVHLYYPSGKKNVLRSLANLE